MNLRKLIGEKAYIYGTGNFATRIKDILEKANIQVLAFLELSKEISTYEQIPVVKLGSFEKLDKLYPVIIGLGNPTADVRLVHEKLQEVGFQTINPIQFAIASFKSGYAFENYWLIGDTRLYQRCHSDIDSARLSLTDTKSRKIFDKIIAYRTTGEILELPERLSIDDQYLAPDLPWGTLLHDGVSVLDGGAFDGDTYENFKKKDVAIKFWNFIEPDSENFAKIKSKFSKLNNDIEFTQACLSQSDGFTKFESTGHFNNGSRVSNKGQSQIQTRKIDSFSDANVYNFIKFDIEGEELNALKGGMSTILKYRPVLAISTYHLPEHHWQIINYLCQHLEHYTYYLRVHGEQTFDTILYAFPGMKD